MSGEGIALYSLMESDAAERGVRNLQRLMDVRDRADELRAAGVAVPTLREFEKAHPVEKPSLFSSIAKGAANGAAVAAAFFAVGALIFDAPVFAAIGLGSLVGIVLGGIAGTFEQSKIADHGRLVDAYAKHIEALEHAPAPAHAQESSVAYRTDHADKVLAARSHEHAHHL